MNFEAASKEVFQILRSYDYEMALFDEDGQEIYEPEDARRFCSKKKNLLVAIVDEGDKSEIRLIFRRDIPVESITGLMNTLRMTATKFNMTLSTREQDGEITPKDFATKMSVTERKEMNLTEGMYGTSRSSYLRLENARMIVRHSEKIDEKLMGARGRNVEVIFIENGVGERFRFPTAQLAPARAMTHHVSNGGCWGDEGGEAICSLAKDYSNLGALSRHIRQNAGTLEESAQGVRHTVREAMRKLRKTCESICRKTRYEDVMQSLKKPLNEDDLSEAVAKLKGCCTVEGREIDESIYETAARCMKEVAEKARVDNSLSIAGVGIDKSTWDRFKKGHMALTGHPQEPSDVEGYRSFIEAALRAIAPFCADHEMGEVCESIADKFAKAELTSPLKAFASKAMEIVGWKVPKTVAPMEAVKELAEWMDEDTVVEEEEVDEHCGHCPEDLEEEQSYLVDLEPEAIGGDDELSIDDLIFNQNQGDDLAAEISVSTVKDPHTGEEVLPTNDYIQQIRSVSGSNQNSVINQRSFYS